MCDDRKIRRGLRIIPADTWKQPSDNIHPLYITLNEETSLNRLNEDCLIEIFEQLDWRSLINLSQLCERLSDIIHRRIFPSVRRVTLNYDPKRTVDESVDSSWNILTDVLHCGTEVEFKTNSYIEYPNMIRFADIVTRNSNENLERLAMFGVSITDRMRRQLKPVFKPLKAFESHFHGDTNNICVADLVNFCHALKELTLRGNTHFGSTSIQPLPPWKPLESASLHIHFDRVKFLRFLYCNLYLRNLDLDVGEYVFENITDELQVT